MPFRLKPLLLVSIAASAQAWAAPTVVTPATATQATVTGTQVGLSVLGDDANGETGLSYTWIASGPGPVAFDANGDNAAKLTTATFDAAGDYQLTVTVADAAGQSAQGTVEVTVQQMLSTIAVTPATITVDRSGRVTFAVQQLDQFGVPLTEPGGAQWAVSGGGSIDDHGVFTALDVGGGPYMVSASVATFNGTAQVTIRGAPSVDPAPPEIADEVPAPAEPAHGGGEPVVGTIDFGCTSGGSALFTIALGALLPALRRRKA